MPRTKTTGSKPASVPPPPPPPPVPAVVSTATDETASLSSATEEWHRKRQRKKQRAESAAAAEAAAIAKAIVHGVRQTAPRRKQKKPRRDPAEFLEHVKPAPVPVDLLQETIPDFKIDTFDALFREYPYLLEPQHIQKGSAASHHMENFRLDQEQFRQQIEEEKRSPPILVRFQQLLARLVPPEFSLNAYAPQHTLTGQDILRRIKQRQLILPVFTAEYENTLLAQAGDWKMEVEKGVFARFPFAPCMWGAEGCVLSTHWKLIPGLTEPIVGTAILYHDEMRGLRMTKALPLGPRPCILCMRTNAMMFVLFVRAFRKLVKVDETLCFQLYTNLWDQPGGYFGEYMLHPQPQNWEGFIDPIVRVQLSLLHAHREAQGRWYIDQSALIWRPPDTAARAPLVGESQRDFLLRSKALGNGPTTLRAMVRQSLRDPRTALLRDAPEGRVAIRDPAILAPTDRRGYTVAQAYTLLRCLVQRLESQTTASYALAATYDSLLWSIWGLTGRRREDADEERVYAYYCDVICEDTVPDYSQKIYGCSFWYSGRAAQDPIVHIFSKVLPQRCAGRKFGVVFAEFLKSQPLFRDVIREWFVAALLGNFRRHVNPADRIRCGWFRGLLYYLVWTGDQTIDAYLAQYPCISMWVLRYMIVQWISDQPAFVDHVDGLFDWQVCEELTLNAIQQIRRCVYHRVCVQRDLWQEAAVQYTDKFAIQPAPSPPPAEVKSIETEREMDMRTQKAWLKIAYHRSRESLLANFFILRPKELTAVMNYTLEPEFRSCIWQWILRTPNLLTSDLCVADVAVQMLQSFGVKSTVVEQFQDLIQLYDEEMAGKKLIKTGIHVFALKHPFVYTLLRDFCELWKVYDSVQCWPLPGHYTRRQAQAVREVYQLTATASLPSQALIFWYCGVCHATYSVVHSSDTRLYEFGYANAVVDYTSGKLYCGNHHTVNPPLTDHNILPAEADRPYNTQLTSVVLLGQILRLDHTLYTLCPGERCGRAMVVDPENNLYTDRGLVCNVCSQRIRAQRQFDAVMQPLQQAAAHCLMCHRPLEHTATRHIYLYPGHTRLCRRHHVEQGQTAVARLADTVKTKYGRELFDREVLNCLLAVREQRRDHYRQLHKKRHQHILAVHRQQTRARK